MFVIVECLYGFKTALPDGIKRIVGGGSKIICRSGCGAGKVALMRGPTWITAQDLNRWAATPAGKTMLPELLRRLVRATIPTKHLKKLDFPSGAEVQRPGYDGTTVTTQGTPYIPEGVAFWEIGCEVGNAKGKADGDYEKRIREHDKKVAAGEVDDISQTTYVAVTAFDWQGANAWAAARTAEGKFKAVDAYDSNRLEHWIWEASAVGLWLAQEIHGHRDGVWDVASNWGAMQGTLNRTLPPEVLLINRTKTAATFEKWLAGPIGELAIKAPSREELVEVFCAWVLSLPPDQSEQILSRAIVVENRDTWRALATSLNPLILIAASGLDSDKDLFALAARNHHVLRFAPFTAARNSGAFEMERMRRFDLQQALKKAGMPDADAAKTAEAAGGNFTILRRILARTPEDTSPTWAADANLAPLLLVAAWKDQNAHDQQAIVELAGHPYCETQVTVTKWWREPDQPVRLVDGTWEFLSPVDAWEVLHPFTLAHLDRFERLAIEILSEDNPALDLPPDERVMASYKGKVRRYSGELRHGIAEILALGASREEESSIGPALRFAERATKIVRELLPPGCSWKRWASLGGILTHLVEAAPETVIEAAERDLRSVSPALVELMRQEIPPSGLSGAAYHSGVLWALEKAAWAPKYLQKVSFVLARLDELDPGGKWANRPRGSLSGIFFSWRPQTVASVGERLETLRLLADRVPVVGWRLLLSVIPEINSVISDHTAPSYRDWAAGWTGEVTVPEYRSYISMIVDFCLLMVEREPKRWLDLIEKINRIGLEFPDVFTKLLGHLRSYIGGSVSAEIQIPLWEKLREIVQRHRHFQDAVWALPESEIQEIAALRDQLRPKNSVVTLKPLFDDFGLFDEDNSLTYEQKIERRAAERRTAIRQIWNEGGFPLLARLAETAAQAWDVGRSIAEELKAEPQSQMLPALLTSANAALQKCVVGYATQRIWTEGQDWAEEQPNAAWTDAQVAVFALQMAFHTRTWDWIARFGEPIERLYWEETRALGGHDLPEDAALRAVRRLQEFGRPWSAIEILAMRLHKKVAVAPTVLCDALEATLSTPLKPKGNVMDVHDAQEVFAFLQLSPEADTARLARLEFAFLPMLDRYSLLPRTLQRELARNPAFFVECLTLLYRPHSAPKPTEEEQAPTDPEAVREKELQAVKAQRIWQLLHDWCAIPGSDPEGNVVIADLHQWVAEARRLAKDADRIAVCDIHIGQVFARSNKDESDDAKPVLAVREVIEECDSEEVGRGFVVGLHNLRGSFSKGIYEGGDQERELASLYNRYADACSRWPRTAALLRRVADGYLRDAAREDERAKAQE